LANIVWRGAARRLEGRLNPLLDRWLDRGVRSPPPPPLATISQVTVVRAHTSVARDTIASDFAAHVSEYVDELGSRVVANNGPLDARELKRLRTALRRLRALVRETADDQATADDYDRLVRRAGKRLGDVRDLDVAILGIAARRAVSGSELEHAALDELEARLARDRDAAFARASKRLGASALEDVVLGARRHVAWLAGDGRFEPLARQWWTATRAELLTALDQASPIDDDLEVLHEIRIAARRARYGAELFGPLAPVEAVAWRRESLDLQHAIGLHRDAALLHARLSAEVERATDRRRITLARGLEASIIGARGERMRTFIAARDAIAKARARPLEGPPQLRGNDAASSPTRKPPGRSGLA